MTSDAALTTEDAEKKRREISKIPPSFLCVLCGEGQ
jgi:hypothetical protein